jgi:uncharacterized protein YecT (DUF1311 family)
MAINLLAPPVEARQSHGSADRQSDQLASCQKAAQSTVEILDCLADANRRDDTILNRDYQRIMKRLDAPKRASLRASERRWLVERRRDCRKQADAYSTGSWWPVIYGSCVEASTSTRIRWLRQRYR